ncbi:MAG: sulfite exporter TauE/SafE family protein [Candidatus Lambdaproteobacteria bacterium]|nr:sulfite exporter TauE/SafE family protein [Candidatus Lambdaproteobacteria bacterium]
MHPDPVKDPSPVLAALAFWLRPRSLLVGLGAGLVNGLVGIGGGLIIVPGLMFVGRLSPREAVSTSLGAVMLLSLMALSLNLAMIGLHVSPLGAAALLAAGFAGAQLGGIMLNVVSQRVVLILFAALTLFFSGHMLAFSAGWVPAVVDVAGEPPLWGYPVVGVVAGFFSGMLGIGGGGLVILGLSLLFHTPVAGGLPLAQMVNAVNAFSGVLAQFRSRRIHWREVARLVPASFAGAALGTWAALVLPANVLRIIFALFFLFMGLRMLRRSGAAAP